MAFIDPVHEGRTPVCETEVASIANMLVKVITVLITTDPGLMRML
jgi:hypothetical protein